MRRDYGISINWEEVHAITHGLHDNPHHILGPHLEWDGVVINAYVKDALKVEVVHTDSDVRYEMRASGIADFFTLATDEKTAFPYKLRATYRNGTTFEYVDAYCFEPTIDNQDLAAFHEGICYDAYQLFGAHRMTINGVEGVRFAVWAPNAQRVSVVGEFNLWEGSRGLMRRVNDSDVFELFIPGLGDGTAYKYEIRTRDGRYLMKSDPYASRNEVAPSDASLIFADKYQFKDGKWLKNRDASAYTQKAMNVLEVNLFDYARSAMGGSANYRNVAGILVDYVKDMGYTHVELMPVMDAANEMCLGYETKGFYAVSSRLGSPEDFKYLIDMLHQNGIGVLLDWAPYQFSKNESGLYRFDGAPLYEDSNALRSEHPLWGTAAFNYGRKEVSNYLISNALYWVEEFHADGLVLADVASMLYLDYGRNPGEWLPNIYGSNENLDAVELFKHMNSIMKKRNPGVLMIAEDSSLWQDVTTQVEDDGLGFDYKRNLGWSEDMMDYVETPVGSRRDKHNALTFSLLYAYNEQYMYGFSHKNIGVDGLLMNQIDGNQIQKENCVKALLGYLMMQPGKKYTFLEQSLPLTGKSVEREQYAAYVKALNALYVAEPALYAQDYDENGFEWINTLSAKDGILVFARKTANADDTLVVILNLSGSDYQNYQIGVPYSGKYKEIFNSDATEFGGANQVNARMRQSKAEACDAREHSITTTVPAFGISVYKYNVAGTVTPVKKTTKKTASKTTAKKAESKTASKTVAKKTVEKKAEPAKAAEKKPVESKAETTKAAEKKPVESKAETTKAAEKKPVESKAETTKAAEKKPVESKAETTKAAEKKPVESKAETTKAAEKKPVESKAETTKAVEKKPEETKKPAPTARKSTKVNDTKAK